MGRALTGLEPRSLVTAHGTVRISPEPVELDAPGPDELVVRVEAAPINPSDPGLLLGPADPETLRAAVAPGLVARR
jgi:NADPH:quinone reductase-like Zn-dependent oxidoreductase